MDSEFPQTRMSVLQRIQTGSDEERRAALTLFFEGYRPALIKFLVKCKKVDETEAEDLVQDFMINKVMTGKILNHDEEKGRFRNLLRFALQREFFTEVERKKRRRIDDHIEPNDQDQPSADVEDFIDQAWAVGVFSSALARLKADCEHWCLFFDRVLTQPPLPYHEIIETHGYEDPEKASNFLITAKRSFNRILHNCIREQSDWADSNSDSELKEEIEYLRTSLSNPSILREAVQSFDESTVGLAQSTVHEVDTFHAEQFSFIEDSSDSNWSDSDNEAILHHLLQQPINKLGIDSQNLPDASTEACSVGEFLGRLDESPVDLELIATLRKFFNSKAKSRKSGLPNRIDVTMTFIATARYVVSGGEVNDITSLGANELAARFEMLVNKDWIPDSIRSMIHAAILRCRA